MRISSTEVKSFRSQTRRERYQGKFQKANTMPVSMATINLGQDVNVAYVVRSAACFGAEELFVIGSVLPRDTMNALSGSTFDYVKVTQFSTPREFIDYAAKYNIQLISLELPSEYFDSVSIHEFEFDFTKRSCLIVGHETAGVPVEILLNSKRVYIPMNGFGYCLNVSQAANIGLYEVAKRYENKV